MTKSELNAAVSRIERAPNVTLLMRTIEAAYPDNAISVNRVRGQWEVSDSGFAHYASDFADVRRRLASFIEDVHSHTLDDEPSEQAAPDMVTQPVQQQQANAGAVTPSPVQKGTAVDLADLAIAALDSVELEKKAKALSEAFDRIALRSDILREISQEASSTYWDCRNKSNPGAVRRSKAEVHAKHVLDEMTARADAALAELRATHEALKHVWRLQGRRGMDPVMVSQSVQQQQANAGAAAAPGPVPSRLLTVVHGPDGADDPRLGGLAALRDLLRACRDQRAFLALLGDNEDEIALCETIRAVEDLYRRLAQLVGQRTDIHDREHPDRVAEGQAWLDAGSDIPF